MYRKKACQIFSCIFLLLYVSSCREVVQDFDNGESIKIYAGVESEYFTRSYQEEGLVEEGLFNLTFPQANSSDNVGIIYDNAKVNFINATGIVLNSEDKELSWDYIGYDGPGSNSSTLFLDNLTIQGDDATSITLPSPNPFHAGVLDKVNGCNDLLWGSLSSDRSQRQLYFQLHHCMSRVSVKIFLDNSGISDNIDLKNASVEISDLVLSPASFNRLTGQLELDRDPNYSTLKLVESMEDWGTVENYDENRDFIYYQTKDFVLPPQELKKDMSRPQLTITIPSENGEPRIYYAVLPNAMTVTSREGVSFPTTLSFMRELNLILSVIIKPEEPEIKFMPVTVVDWEDLDRISFSGTQAGIYSADDFYNLITAYKESDEEMLLHYGYKNPEGIWVFNIFLDGISLELSKIKGQMSGDDYTFDFHNHNLSVFGEDEVVIILKGRDDGATQLIELLNQ